MDIRGLLQKAIAIAGGSQAKLGRACGGLTQNTIYHAHKRGEVSAELAIRIHHATKGEVPADQLRPDLPWPHKSEEPAA